MVDLLSCERIRYSEVQLRPYNSYNFVTKLFYELNRFYLLGHMRPLTVRVMIFFPMTSVMMSVIERKLVAVGWLRKMQLLWLKCTVQFVKLFEIVQKQGFVFCNLVKTSLNRNAFSKILKQIVFFKLNHPLWCCSTPAFQRDSYALQFASDAQVVINLSCKNVLPGTLISISWFPSLSPDSLCTHFLFLSQLFAWISDHFLWIDLLTRLDSCCFRGSRHVSRLSVSWTFFIVAVAAASFNREPWGS